MCDLNGQVALVTGASRGIGAATALCLAQRGSDVALNHFNDKSSAEEVATRIRRLGRKVEAFDCDVSDHKLVAIMAKDVIEVFGQVNLLVNNAGISRDSVVWNMSEEQWDQVIDVNLKGCFNTVNALAPHFRERRSGKIVNVSSINAMKGRFGLANYAASKAGMIGLTRALARELGKYNININAVAPGLVLTDLTAGLSDDAKSSSLAETALGRLGEPADIANVIVFLCSDEARHITGEVIRVDGGQLA